VNGRRCIPYPGVSSDEGCAAVPRLSAKNDHPLRAPGCLPPLAEVLRPRPALGPFAGWAGDWPCLMFGPKSSDPGLFGAIWPSGCRSAPKSAWFAVDTTDFFADFLAALVAALAAPDIRRSHTLGIRLAGLRAYDLGNSSVSLLLLGFSGPLQAALPGCH
jgi:hypothetical protein